MYSKLGELLISSSLFYRVAGLCGVLSPIVAFVCIGLAISYSPWFSWTENWLSDLGGMVGEEPIWAARGIASILFNIGLIIAGILGIVLGIALRKSLMSSMSLGRLGSLFLILDMCALCAVGIFPETTGNPHLLASFAFFFLILLSLLLIGTTLRKLSEKTLGLFTITLGIVSLITFPLFFIPRPWGSNAIPEMISSVSIGAFAIVFGIRLFRLP